MDVLRLADDIINGKRFRRGSNVRFFIDCDLNDLRRGADRIRDFFRGDHVDLCAIINGRSGHCGEDCKFCAQSVLHDCGLEAYDFLSADTIVAAAKSHETDGIARFSIVTSGRTLSDGDFEKALAAYTRLSKECRIALCASFGALTKEQFARLYDTGVRSYHANIETSRRFFPQICTTHTFEDKLKTIRLAKAAGFQVCSGGIIGMGERWEDRLDMALTLYGLEILSIPINVLTPIPGTPLEGLPALSEEDILRTVAFFRYINPAANIRLAAGRTLLRENGKEAFRGGASAAISGNMLTTAGCSTADDRQMLDALGRDSKPRYSTSSTCG